MGRTVMGGGLIKRALGGDDETRRLAGDLHRASTALSECVRTDVQIDPLNLLMALIRTTDRLQETVTELGRAVMSVDEPAARAAYLAAERLTEAGAALDQALLHMFNPEPPPAGPDRRPPRSRRRAGPDARPPRPPRRGA